MHSLVPNQHTASSPGPQSVMCVLGTQWGDEGKGKLVDRLVSRNVDVCCRCQGGDNAGHTIVIGNLKFDFHLLPSGFVNPDCINVIGNGVVVHLPSLFRELERLESKGIVEPGKRLRLSSRAHLVFDVHQIADALKEKELGGCNIGTTKRGIGPAYSSKASRSGLRVHHLMEALLDHRHAGRPWRDTFFIQKFLSFVENRRKRYGPFEYDVDAEVARYQEFAARIESMVADTVQEIHKYIRSGRRVLVEGVNALMLDLDFGTYPFVTSSNCSIGGVCTGLGLPPKLIGPVYGVVKSYTTRVGGGPFPTEQLNAIGEHLQTVGAEFGVTTGRKRRCGWLDIIALRYSNMINGYTKLNLTKLDVLDGLDEIKIGVGYRVNGEILPSFPSDLSLLDRVEVEYETMAGWKVDITACRDWSSLPSQAQAYVIRVENLIGVPSRCSMVHEFVKCV